MVYIYPDTNIFLHGKHFEQIGWQAIAGPKKDFTIVITGVVINELDKHKYSVQPRRAQKAKTILPRLEEIFENPSASPLKIINPTGRLAEEIFNEYGLDKTQMDDVLIATILSDRWKYHQQDEIILLTNDTGPRIKARTHGIKTMKPAESDMLPAEQDEHQKTIKKLENELLQIKSRQPEMQLMFANGVTVLRILKEGELKSFQEMLAEKEAEWKKEFPKMADAEMENDKTNHLLQLNRMFAVSQDQVDDYNKKLDDYFNDLRTNLKSAYTAGAFHFNSFKIEMEITNVGTIPAEDVDLNLHFPDGFDLLEKMPKIPKRPSPPHKPKSAVDRVIPPISIPVFPLYNPSGNLPEINLHAPSIKKTNSYDVDYTIGNLKHHQPFQLDPLFVHFEHIREARGFAIDYKISVGNLPQPVTGQLHVQIEIK